MDCHREVISIFKIWKRNKTNGKQPRARVPNICPKYGFEVDRDIVARLVIYKESTYTIK